MTTPLACATYGAHLHDLSADAAQTLEFLACTVLEERDVRAEAADNGRPYSSAIREWPGARLLAPGAVPRDLAQPVGPDATLSCAFAARFAEGTLHFGQTEEDHWWVLGPPEVLGPWLQQHAPHLRGEHGLWIPT